jgi:large subunit ribosomal protein L3
MTPKVIQEVRVSELPADLNIGDAFDVTIFTVGDNVDVTGISKGKGFAGTVKRHNFNTSKSTHGGNGNVRKPGSIGSMYPQKIFKGKRMAGQMGHEQVTVRNLTVAYVDLKTT